MEKIIELCNGGSVLIDEFNYKLLTRWSWHKSRCGYAERSNGNTTISMHRQIMNPPKGFDIDHINRNKLDNRIINLRIVTRTINNLNRRTNPKNKLGHNGISITNCGTFRVRIGNRDLPRCKTLDEAIFLREREIQKLIDLNEYENETRLP